VKPAKPGEGDVRRLAVAHDELVTRPTDNVNTTSDIISYAAQKYTNREGRRMARYHQNSRGEKENQEDGERERDHIHEDMEVFRT
jgi:formylmethanofuran dehydrogenase subunit B